MHINVSKYILGHIWAHGYDQGEASLIHANTRG